MSYYSGWDARRVASKLVSEYLAGDDENRGEGEERQNRDNGNAEGNSNVADEQTPISANDGHDDIDLQAGDARDITGTNNASFYDVDGRIVPVSADTHYLHRDKRLKAYTVARSSAATTTFARWRHRLKLNGIDGPRARGPTTVTCPATRTKPPQGRCDRTSCTPGTTHSATKT